MKEERHKAYAEMLGKVADYLRKPFPMEVLLESIRRIFSTKSETSEKKKKAGSAQASWS